MKIFLFLSFFSLLFLSACSTEIPQENKKTGIEFETTSYDFGIIKQSAGVVSFSFPFQYFGEETLKVEQVVGSCACTTGSVDKTIYQPGESGVLTVEFNPNLHAEPEGRFYKTVSIMTNPPLDPLPEVRVWQEIDLDLGEEFFELSNDNDHEKKHNNISHNGSVPKSENSAKKVFTLEILETTAPLTEQTDYHYWTFGGTVPGPFLRAKVGDEIEVQLKNNEHNYFPHSIDLHAVNGPGGGATETQVMPGQEKSFTFTALHPGIYVYHCATPEVAEHMANGMYGLILIEPEELLPAVDKEFYLMQGEIYSILKRNTLGTTQLSGEKLMNENPEYFVFNGTVGSLTAHNALRASVGNTVRLFIGNGGVSKVSNFHVIGEIFDRVYPEGGTPLQNNIQTTVIPAGGASIVEFTVDKTGTYNIVDHALARVSKGLVAELIVTE